MAKEVSDRTKPFSGPAWDHLRAARREVRDAFGELLPPAFWEHQRAARREVLLSARALIDAALEKMEKQEPKPVTRIKAKA
jgi:hypothetical protein